MDILNCSTSEKSKSGVDMPLIHPGTGEVLFHANPDTGEPEDMYLTILGPESEATNRALAQVQHRASKKKDNHTPSDDEIEAERVADSKLLARLTVGGRVYMDGKWLDVNQENAFDIYYKVMPFRGQVLKFALDLGNFTKT